ncbi:MAG: hypothetical protein Q7R45_14400 [Sulfuricaulis sp.]|nr:hypothetical protein [Sulfuricaulis sp.]
MESGATAPASADNPQESRTCTKCEATKVISPESWPYRKGRQGHYQAYGGLCLECEKARKAAYDERRKAIAAGVVATPVPATGTPDEKRKALKQANKLDVAQALKAGSLVLNQLAPGVMARIAEYLEDPEHKHHIWALELLAQRILPRKLYEELGGQAAGVGALQDRRPMFVLNVLPANPSAPGGAVYDQEGNVQLLTPPAPADESDAG